jgi:hypothetical protein
MQSVEADPADVSGSCGQWLGADALDDLADLGGHIGRERHPHE